MALEIAGLTVRYGAVPALQDLHLAIPPGELFVLLGGSGSGKTTLLRAIAGFLRPAAGRILLDGQDLTLLPPHRRPVNTMFQSYALFPHMSVAANIAFGLRRRGASRAAVAARVAEMLALVRLEGFGDRRPDALSGGQQQRVALARSLAPNPRLLLLDEPLSALDRGLRTDTRAELVRLQRRLGTSFILVTHDQEEALSMAHRIGVMAAGRLAQVGTPAQIYEQPANRFVAEFMGAANVLAGEICSDGTFLLPALGLRVRTIPTRAERDRHAASGVQAGVADRVVDASAHLPACSDQSGQPRAARWPGGGGEMAPDLRGSGLPGETIRGETIRGHDAVQPGPALLALRPERIRLGEGTNRIEGAVCDMAYAGQSVTYVVRLEDGGTIRVTQPLSDGFDPARYPVGGRVTLAFEPEACILLPPE